MPNSTPPGAAMAKPPICVSVSPPAVCAVRAAPKSNSAAASLKRLSPRRMASVERGIDMPERIAVEAAASGGATMAPSTSAAANGSPAKAHPAQPTSKAVTTTPPTAKNTSGSQKRFTVETGKSNAASINAGAMNSGNAVRGSMGNSGVPGIRAMPAPASASIDG